MPVVMTSPNPPNYATPAEVAETLRSLTDAELLRLEELARIRAAGLAWVDWRDLLNETIARSLEGSRRWPTDIAFSAFISESMRSIAFEEIRRRTQGAVITEADLSTDNPHTSFDLMAVADESRTGPQDMVEVSDAVEEILYIFKEDALAQAILIGSVKGLTPDEMCAEAKITRVQYETVQKRIRRRLVRLDATQRENS